MPFDPDRRVKLDGAYNFRDVGGITTKDGRLLRRGILFRSDTLARLSDADLDRVGRLGLRTIVDLRTVQERASNPDRLPADSGVRCVHLPMRDPSTPQSMWTMIAWMVGKGPTIDFEEVLSRQYHAYAFHCSEAIGSLVHLVSDPANLPLLVHCTAGKDRTGFSVAVVLLLLGVGMEDVLAEHMATNELLLPTLPRFVRSLRWFSLGRVSEEQVMPLLTAHRKHIEQVVAEIHQAHGTLPGWLEQACGVDPSALARLPTHLLTSL